MSSGNSAMIDRPRCNTIAMVHLLKRNAGFDHHALHCLGMANGLVGIGIERLDHYPPAP